MAGIYINIHTVSIG